MGKYAVVARRSGSDWYVSMLNAGDKKQISLPIDFLKNRKGYTATLYYQVSEEKKDVVDAKKIAEEEKAYQKIPVITGFVDDEGVNHMKEMVQENYNRIKEDVRRIVADELERIAADPNLRHLLELNK